jgi:phosphoglycolate phosphatase-like HAD superfamily hydrolase
MSLPSWNDTQTKQSILDFVAAVTSEDNPQFVPPSDRIAVFDNDGTLWCEKPMYIQLDYILRRMAERAEEDHNLRSKHPWKAAWERDLQWFGDAVTKHYQGDESQIQVLIKGLLSLAEGTKVEAIEAAARDFVRSVRHPTLDMLYADCIYQPMLELLGYLETNGFINYIVSGGGRDFMRGFSQDLYGIPRDRVIGSTVAYRYAESDHGGEIVQQAEMDVIDDGPGKPVQIWNLTGKRPVLSAGNSNGDLPMLAFTGGASLPALRLLVIHDDAQREFDYTAGAEAAIRTVKEHNWVGISIQRDWRQVFPG